MLKDFEYLLELPFKVAFHPEMTICFIWKLVEEHPFVVCLICPATGLLMYVLLQKNQDKKKVKKDTAESKKRNVKESVPINAA